MRARYPDREGDVQSGGVSVHWEQYGDGDRTVFFIPGWQIVHSRCWKMQIPYFARHFRVLTFDPPGNGRSERPLTGYSAEATAAHALAVLDATSRTATRGGTSTTPTTGARTIPASPASSSSRSSPNRIRRSRSRTGSRG